jgi:dGTPase
MRNELVSRKVQDEAKEPFFADVERILHSKAYVRYADKTQVVYLFPHDHIAYRGLHVQLVSALARSIGRRLGLSLDLIEAISLGHDIGHAPFGHEGEGYLNMLSQEASLGSFSHARQSCRAASEIEDLNLTLATLDGFLCHDGGMTSRAVNIFEDKSWAAHEDELEKRKEDPEGDFCPATKEAAIVKIADTVSYLERDLEDACTLGIIATSEIPYTIFAEKKESISRVVGADLVKGFLKNGTVGLSEDVYNGLQTIRAFNFDRIYFHDRLKSESKKIERAYRLLFDYFLRDWKERGKASMLWVHFLHNKKPEYIEKYCPEQHVVDYIAGMTDGYFLRLFQALFMPRTIEVPNVLPFS